MTDAICSKILGRGAPATDSASYLVILNTVYQAQVPRLGIARSNACSNAATVLRVLV